MDEIQKIFESKLEDIKRSIKHKHVRRVMIDEVLAYIQTKQSQSIGYPRLVRIAQGMEHIVNNASFEPSKMTQEDAEGLFIWINTQGAWKDGTKATMQRIFKGYVTWAMEKYDLKLKLKALKVMNAKNSILPEHL
ncbi:MAG: hypothetical protein ACYCO0_02245 [Candidatus Micrarchaeaceae archaeon]